MFSYSIMPNSKSKSKRKGVSGKGARSKSSRGRSSSGGGLGEVISTLMLPLGFLGLRKVVTTRKRVSKRNKTLKRTRR